MLVVVLALVAGCAERPRQSSTDADTEATEGAPPDGAETAVAVSDRDPSSPTLSTEGGSGANQALEASLWALLAGHRAERDLGALRREASLDALAAKHSAQMLASSQLSHDGSTKRFTSMRQSFGALGAAENVAMACGHGNGSAAVLYRGWLESEGHRANLEADFDLSGLGVASDGECVFATQLFGKLP